MKGENDLKSCKTDAVLTEKEFTRKISVSVALIVFAFFGLTTTAWAVFSSTIDNIQQTISSANFYVESIVTKDGKIYAPSDGLTYESGEYIITLNAKGSVRERSGFCKISVGEKENLYTPQMRTSEQKAQGKLDGYPDTVSFRLILNETATVSFSSSWATYNPEFANKCIKSDGSTVITYGTAPVIQTADVPVEPATVQEEPSTEATVTTKAY